MPYQRQAASVLAAWREIERHLERVPDGTPEAEALQAEAARLRNEYLRLIDAARAAHRPEPPPFPGST